MTPPLTVGALVELLREPLHLEIVVAADGDGDGAAARGTARGLSRDVTSPEVSSPGLVLAGYTDRFVGYRIQVLGETEVSYLASLDPAARAAILARFFAFDIPAVFVTKGQDMPEGLAAAANAAGVSVLRSPLKTNEFYRRMKPLLEDRFAPSTTLHGSLADVFGVGLLFTGKSGIGKSECVLDLVERGHRLVADDLVLVKRQGTDVLIGRGAELQRHFMEVRGIGLVDVRGIFGVRAVRVQKRLEVVVQLEEWDHEALIERTGIDGATTTILGVSVPRITVPLNPGKNITVVAEVIAMNHLLRVATGVNAAEAFNEQLIERMRTPRESHRPPGLEQYLSEDRE